MPRKEKKPVIRLSEDDLREFNIRNATLQSARCQFLMVEEAHIVWSRNVRAKYAIPTVKFNIDPHSGIVTPKEE
jgi:hypothetical protein